MELNTNFVDINNIKSNPLKNYENINTSKLEDDALRKVSDDFESFFMQQLLDISLKNTKVAGEGSGSDIVKGMYTESISKESSGTVGISDMLYNFLSERKR
jgi:Rod binding domain-containing protein